MNAFLLTAIFIGADLKFEATTASQTKVIAGSLDALGKDWSATIGGKSIAAGDLVELRQHGAVLPALPSGAHILLANGDRWPGRVLEIAKDNVRFAPAFGTATEITLPVTAIVAAWLTEGPFQDDPLPTDLDVLTAKRQQDVVRLANRDSLSGTITGVDRETLRIEINGKTTNVPRDRISAIAFTSELVRMPKPKGPYACMVVAGGARVMLTDAVLQDGRVLGTTLAGPTIRLLTSDLVALNIINGPAVYLSELTPAKYEHTPYLGVSYPYTVDRSVAGGPLHLGRDTFDRGIGLHSKSRLAYAVPPGATRFECHLGLDTVAGKQGQVVVTVEVDGKELLKPAKFSGTQPPRTVHWPLDGAKELSILVDFGAAGNVQGHFNLGNARFIKPARSDP